MNSTAPSVLLPADSKTGDDGDVDGNDNDHGNDNGDDNNNNSDTSCSMKSPPSCGEAINGQEQLLGVVSSTTLSPDAAASTADACVNAAASMTPEREQQTQEERPPEPPDGNGGKGVTHHSSAERNIWSVFNPLWNNFLVREPRLPHASADAGVDWARTTGRPEEITQFLGLKNPVNRA